MRPLTTFADLIQFIGEMRDLYVSIAVHLPKNQQLQQEIQRDLLQIKVLNIQLKRNLDLLYAEIAASASYANIDYVLIQLNCLNPKIIAEINTTGEQAEKILGKWKKSDQENAARKTVTQQFLDANELRKCITEFIKNQRVAAEDCRKVQVKQVASDFTGSIIGELRPPELGAFANAAKYQQVTNPFMMSAFHACRFADDLFYGLTFLYDCQKSEAYRTNNRLLEELTLRYDDLADGIRSVHQHDEQKMDNGLSLSSLMSFFSQPTERKAVSEQREFKQMNTFGIVPAQGMMRRRLTFLEAMDKISKSTLLENHQIAITYQRVIRRTDGQHVTVEQLHVDLLRKIGTLQTAFATESVHLDGLKRRKDEYQIFATRLNLLLSHPLHCKAEERKALCVLKTVLFERLSKVDFSERLKEFVKGQMNNILQNDGVMVHHFIDAKAKRYADFLIQIEGALGAQFGQANAIKTIGSAGITSQCIQLLYKLRLSVETIVMNDTYQQDRDDDLNQLNATILPMIELNPELRAWIVSPCKTSYENVVQQLQMARQGDPNLAALSTKEFEALEANLTVAWSGFVHNQTREPLLQAIFETENQLNPRFHLEIPRPGISPSSMGKY
jgi:hypothetical protein